MRRRVLAAFLATGALLTVAAAPASAHDARHTGGVAGVRSATATFHNIATAEQHGYALLSDARKIACIDLPGTGGMGVHWANPRLVGDGRIDPAHPEALVYAPLRDGTLRLAAVEYVALQAGWDAAHDSPPELFGRAFDVTPSPNRFGLPAFYSLHAWVWRHNPAGLFAMWNPNVTCPKEPS
jgi:hypothetical protein